MLKLVFASDTHLKDIDLPEGDILFHCGDYLMAGTLQEWSRNLQWMKRERPKYKSWITVFGNHDRYCESNLQLVKEDLSRLGINALVDEMTVVEGLVVYGSPWVPYINGHWAWECERGNAIRKHWLNIPEGLDILLTHGPGFGIMDQSIRPNGRLSEHFGCWDLKDVILNMDKSPKIHAYGHVHMTSDQEHIIDNYGITKFINCALLDDFYNHVNDPIIVEY